MLRAFSQHYLENQEEMIQQNNLKCFEFAQKECDSKDRACKDNAEENLAAENTSI